MKTDLTALDSNEVINHYRADAIYAKGDLVFANDKVYESQTNDNINNALSNKNKWEIK